MAIPKTTPEEQKQKQKKQKKQNHSETATAISNDDDLRRLFLGMATYTGGSDGADGENKNKNEAPYGLAVVPGSAFDMPSESMLCRLCCAKKEIKELERGLRVIDRALARVLRE